MAISTINLPAPVGTSKTQSGSFTTDAAGDLVVALTATAAVNAPTLSIATTAGFLGGDIITVPGAWFSGGDLNTPVLGVALQAGGTLTIANPAIVTGVASGTLISKWNQLQVAGQPKHVRVTRRDNGDYYDWVVGMEPDSANTSIGGTVALLAKVMRCQPGAVHFAPGMLAASQIYDVAIEY